MVKMRVIPAILAMYVLLTAYGVQAADLPDFADLAKNAGPAVVNISTEKPVASAPEDFFGGMFRNVPPGLEDFFNQFGGKLYNRKEKNEKHPQRKQRSLGSGFIISADGYIVTNNHVVADADVINVNFQGSPSKNGVPAKLIGCDEETDIALLKVDVERALPFLKFGDSDSLRVGEWLLAIGNPFGLDHTVTAGILSAKGRNIHSGAFDNFLQTDASINPGNSGGPLLNMRGEVIGINTAIIASGQGIGFAIPSSMAASITEQIKNGKKVSRGWLGVTIQDVDENTAKALGMKEASGALIGKVMPGDPAAAAGMRDGDIVLRVDGVNIADSSALLRAIAGKRPGSKVELSIWRDGREEKCTVTLGERAADRLTASRDGSSDKAAASNELGLSLRALTAEEAKQSSVEKGLLVTEVKNGSPAAEAEIMVGDIVIKANGKTVPTTDVLSKIIRDEGKKRGAVLLQINRRGDTFFRAVTVAGK